MRCSEKQINIFLWRKMNKSLSLKNKSCSALLQCYIWNNLNGSFWENALWWCGKKKNSSSYLDIYWTLARWFCESLGIQWSNLKKGKVGIFVLGLILSWGPCLFKSTSFFPRYNHQTGLWASWASLPIQLFPDVQMCRWEVAVCAIMVMLYLQGLCWFLFFPDTFNFSFVHC